MAHTKQKAQNGFLLFDVFYEDGTRGTTRCPHPNALDGDARRACLLKGRIA